MRTAQLPLLAVAFAVAACSREPPMPPQASDYAAVYLAVLDSLYLDHAGAERPVTLIVADAKTERGAQVQDVSIQDLKDAGPGVPRDLVPSFLPANRSDTEFTVPVGLPVRAQPFDSVARTRVFPPSYRFDPTKPGNDPWRAFYRVYPGSAGIASFSRIGFDRTDRWALVFFRRTCASLCMEGYRVLLRREPGGWRVFRVWLTIVS